jgi:transcriptional regulator with XRE-family HTH domain
MKRPRLREYTGNRSAQEVRDRLLLKRPSLARAWAESRPKRELALFLVRMRKAAGLTQQEVSDRAGWDKSYVSRLESENGGIPDLATISRFAEACNAVAGLLVAMPEGDHFRVTGSLEISNVGAEPDHFARLRDTTIAAADGVVVAESAKSQTIKAGAV